MRRVLSRVRERLREITWLRALWWRNKTRLRLVKRVVEHPRVSLRHFSQFKIVRPDVSAHGGIFNPGCADMDDGSVLLIAKRQNQHWLDALAWAPSAFMAGDVLAWPLKDATGPLKSAIELAPTGYPEGEPLSEDYRLFRWRGALFANHPVTGIAANGARTDHMVLSQLDLENRELRYLGAPRLDFPVSSYERNWLYLEHEGELHLLYSMNPLRVLKLTDEDSLSFTTIIDESAPQGLRDPAGWGAFVAFSTNPIVYSDDAYLLFVHQRVANPFERYIHWAVLMDRQTLRPTRMSREPIFDGTAARGRVSGALYVMGATANDSQIVVFAGEGDSFMSRCVLSRDALNAQWLDL